MKQILVPALIVFLTVSVAKSQDIPSIERTALVIGQKGASLSVIESGSVVTAHKENAGQIRKVIIAVDNSNSMTKVLPKISASISKSLPASLSVPVKIVVYNEQVQELSKFTTDTVELSRASSAIQPSRHKTSLLALLAYLHSSSEADGSHVILITDGDAERGTYNSQKLAEEYAAKNIVLSYVNWRVRQKASSAGNPAAADDVVSTSHDHIFISSVYRSGGLVPKPSSDSQKGRIKFAPVLLLSTIANRTGGDVVDISDFSDLELYLKNRYSEMFLYRLKWQSPNPEAWFKVVSGSASIEKVLHPRIW